MSCTERFAFAAATYLGACRFRPHSALLFPAQLLSSLDLKTTCPRASSSPVARDLCKLFSFAPPAASLHSPDQSLSILLARLFFLALSSASHVCILLAKKYPNVKIVNFDRLDCKPALVFSRYLYSFPALTDSFVPPCCAHRRLDCSCIENLDCVKHLPNYKFVKGNICSSDLVNFVLETENIDTIMHFAAQTHVDNSFGNSFQFTQNNIMGTHVLLESAKVLGIKRFIHVSTDEVYGEQRLDQEAMDEEAVLEPTNPYAATKAGAEFLAKSYHRSFGMPIIITRGNNVYGPHQYPEKLIPKFINQLMRGRPVTLHGTGSNTRNFLYVEDVARAFEIILFKAQVRLSPSFFPFLFPFLVLTMIVYA